MIIGSDYHGDVRKVERFLNYKPEVQHVYCGDILDSRGKTPLEEIKGFNLLIESNSIFLLGNHEIHYLDNAPFVCSNAQYLLVDTYRNMLEENIERFKIAFNADGYVCTHGGVHEFFVKENDSADDVVATLTQHWKDYLKDRKGNINKEIFNISCVRGGNNSFSGPFWFDYKRDIGLAENINQVFGHTQHEIPLNFNFNSGCESFAINTYDKESYSYIFDTGTRSLVRFDD